MQHVTLTNCMKGPFDIPADLILGCVTDSMTPPDWGRRTSELNKLQTQGKGLRMYPNNHIQIPKIKLDDYLKKSRAFKGMIDDGLLKVGPRKVTTVEENLKNSSTAVAPDNLLGLSKAEGFDFMPFKKGGKDMGVLGMNIEIEKGEIPTQVSIQTEEVTHEH